MNRALIITGIGDQTDHLGRATQYWESQYDLEPVMHIFGWEGGVEETDHRLDNLREHFARVGAKAIVGVSAGASAGAILATENPGVAFVNDCGRLHQAGNNIYRFERYRTRAPIFIETVSRAEAVLRKLDPDKSLVFRARLDHLVPKNANFIDGVRTITVLAPTHSLGIYYALRWHGEQIAQLIE